jgi:hypothetical protein
MSPHEHQGAGHEMQGLYFLTPFFRVKINENVMFWQNVVSMDPVCCTCYLSNPNEPSAPNKAFRFDGVYDEGSSTENIYNEIAYPLIEVSLRKKN